MLNPNAMVRYYGVPTERVARLEAGDVSIRAKSVIYTEGTELENLPKDIMTMHETAEAAAETLEQLNQMQQTEQTKPEEKKEEVKKNEPKQ